MTVHGPPAAAPDYRAAAQRLAAEVRAEPSQRTWRRVTSLLDMFGQYRLTAEVRTRVAEALDEAELDAEPAIEDVHRHDTVRLSARGDRKISTVSRMTATKMLRIFEWLPGRRPREIELAAAREAEGVIWVDLDVLTVEAEDAEKALDRVGAEGVTRELIDDLLSADQRPKVQRFDGDSVRLVATVQVTAEEVEASDDAVASKAGRLVFRPLEIAAGERWIVTARHRGGVYRGATEVDQRDPLPLEELIADVERGWLAERAATAGDLGMLILDDLATSYRAAHRELYAWLETWELDFNDRLHATEQETLKDIRGMLTLMRVRLTALSPAHDRPSDAWFAGLTDDSVATSLDRRLERSLRQLDEAGEALRSSLQVLTTAGTAEQLRLAQLQSRRSERLDERITAITSLLLVPTLVVGIYGANTDLPGRDHWGGFFIMLALIVVSAVLSLVLVRRARHGDEDEPPS
jgi:Mg2+ and Co2+ transporter CorA